ncbi:MAG: hypothetical protein KJO65_10245 [Gemmatimonadetes bacterium]|nr:hypothetical protein [Gemmatimonadota bacterium]
MFDRRILFMGISALVAILIACDDVGPTGPEGTWNAVVTLEAIEVVADCEGPPEDSPGEWTWRVRLEVGGQAEAEVATANYPAFAGHVTWEDGETYPIDGSLAVTDIPGSQVPSVVLSLEATEWDVGTAPPTPDALMNGREVRHSTSFAPGLVEDSVDLSDDSGKCSIRMTYSVLWEEAS